MIKVLSGLYSIGVNLIRSRYARTYKGPALLTLSIFLGACYHEPVINTIGHEGFDSLGRFTVSIPDNVIPAEKVQFYFEASGSMNGLFYGNRPTRFKNDISSLITKYEKLQPDGVKVFTDISANTSEYSVNEFRTAMNTGRLKTMGWTEVPTMIDAVLKDLRQNGQDVAVLVSDMKYSPAKNQATALDQYSIDIRNKFHDQPFSVSLIGLESNFIMSNGREAPEFPYYMLLIGKTPQVTWFKERIISTLDGSVQGYMDFNMNYDLPNYSVLPIAGLKGLIRNTFQTDDEMSYSFIGYGAMEKSSEFIVAADYSYLPPEVSEKLTTDDFEISSYQKANVKVELMKGYVPEANKALISRIDADTYLRVEYSDLHPQFDCDVISIKLNTPEPTSVWVEKYFGAAKESDMDRTISLEQLIKGLGNAYPVNNYQREPMWIMISTFKY